MTAKVFIDGQAGTIGLRIRSLLAEHREVRVLEIEESERKSAAARQALLNACDVAVLCLPDEASRQAVSWIENPDVRVIDGSTAFRVAEGWQYGLPELSAADRRAVAEAKRVANPGCWPTAAVLLLRPLVDTGLLPANLPLGIHGVSGYSGGGRSLIERWQSDASGLAGLPFEAPYSLGALHKHIPEMMRHGRLEAEPYFRPAVGAFECGMRVQIPLHAQWLAGGASADAIFATYRERYGEGGFVVPISPSESQSIDELSCDPRACNGTNRVELRAIAHPSGHVLLMAVLDNLGKGASGAAVQSLNLMLGLPESTGLRAR